MAHVIFANKSLESWRPNMNLLVEPTSPCQWRKWICNHGKLKLATRNVRQWSDVRVRIHHANRSFHGFWSDEEMALEADTDVININITVLLAQGDSKRCLSNLVEKARR